MVLFRSRFFISVITARESQRNSHNFVNFKMICGCEKVTPKKSEALEKTLENWMTNLSEKLKRVPLIHLAIPGSHDSMTYSLTRKSQLAPDAEEIILRFRILGPILRTVMARWGKTQGFKTALQLNSGIRYFDLRVATRAESNLPYFVHGLYADDVMGQMTQIKQFLDEHPGEVVILDFQHFYAFTSSDHEKLISLLVSVFGNKLMPYTSTVEDLTLEYMTSKYHYQVIVVYRWESRHHSVLWPSSSFPNPWPNTVEIDDLIKKLDAGISSRSPHTGYVTQLLLTPTSWFVFKNLFRSLKSKCVIPLEKVKSDWIERQQPGPNGINVVICDYIDILQCQFPKQVISLNDKLLICDSRHNTCNLTPIE